MENILRQDNVIGGEGRAQSMERHECYEKNEVLYKSLTQKIGRAKSEV
jgi:hypothetical protein